MRQAESRPGEVLVRFRDGVSEPEREAVVSARSGRRRGALRGPSGVERVELAASQSPHTAAAELRAMPSVEFAEPNYVVTSGQRTADDPLLPEQWALRNTGQAGGRAGSDAGAQEAWQISTGSAQTVIAVIDSGIDFAHPDLSANRWENPREREDGRDNDRNGFVDDVSGWDWVEQAGRAVDPHGHGTAVAGVIAAEGNNAHGTAGVMWRASLMSLRVLDNTGTGDVAAAVEAIDYAVAEGARIINVSWGTNGESLSLKDSLERAAARGVLVVCSAGNDARNVDGVPYYPASFDLPNVIAVAASDNSDRLAAWSNWGGRGVEVAAPGSDVLTTRSGGGHRAITGTSAAAPVVAGVAGLVLSHRPDLRGPDVRAAIIGGARRVAGLDGVVASGGVVSAAGALRAVSGVPFGGTWVDNGNRNNGGGNGNGGSVNGSNGQGRGPNPPQGPPERGAGGRGPGGSFDAIPLPPSHAAPPGFVNQDGVRRAQPSRPGTQNTITANTLPVCDLDCGGSEPLGGAGGSDPYFSTERVEAENETGEPGVDLGSRNFNWGIPLVRLPGRAGHDLDVGLAYNSLVWTKQDRTIQFNPDHGFPGVGFRLGFPILQPQYINASTEVSAYLMVTPSGGRVEMVRVSSIAFESADGSYTQLTFDGSGNPVVWTTDGTQYKFAHFAALGEYRCVEIRDRNGNYITVNYGPINGDSSLGRPTSVVDTLGRTLTFHYDGNNYLRSITQSWRRDTVGGYTNETFYWARFDYGTLPVQVNFADEYGALTVVGPGPDPIPVLTRVTLPDNSAYSFEYTTWGQVYRINHHAPDGHVRARTAYNLPTTTAAQPDCPRFTEQREWAEYWNGDTDRVIAAPEEAVTTYNVAADNSVTEVTPPDPTPADSSDNVVFKQFFATSGWQRGLETGSEVWVGGVKKKWTTTDWTQDVTGVVGQPIGDYGFENPYVGYGWYQTAPQGGAWTFTNDAYGAGGISGHASALTNGNPWPPEGGQVAFLYGGSGGGFSQTIQNFKAGVPYTLFFWAAQRRYSNPGQDIDVYLDDRLIGSFRPVAYYFYSAHSVTFFTTPGAHTLKFVGRNYSACALVDSVSISTSGEDQANPRVAETNVYEPNKRRRTTIAYHDQFNLPQEVKEYAADGVTPARSVHTDFNLDPAYVSRRIIGLPSTTMVMDRLTEQPVSKVTYDYDWGGEYLAATPQQAVQHGANHTDPTGRGNLSRVRRWNVTDINNPASAVEVARTGYNSTGTVAFTRDALSHQISFSYADSFTASPAQPTYAYPTTVTDADGFSSTAQYNYDMGTVFRAQDPKGAAGKNYFDPEGRPERTVSEVNGGYTRYAYPLDGGQVMSFSKLDAGQDETYTNTTLDGAGRPIIFTALNQHSAGLYLAAQTRYDALGRVVARSNPTEVTAAGYPAGDDAAAGYLFTGQAYDWQGRPTVTTFPGAGHTAETTYDGCGCAGGEVATVRDERGRRRRYTKDAFGRLWKVEELNWDTSVYSTTTYAYNARDQIETISQQGLAPRSFQYDGHGRLWKRTTPEQGMTEYSYYLDDTAHWVKDARGAKTEFSYNQRHLPWQIEYKLGEVLAGQNVAPTATVQFGYDAAGNRTSMTDGLGTATYHYDTLSRMDWEERTFAGVWGPNGGAYRLSYEYTWAGQLKRVTNPWGAQTAYEYDREGRVTDVRGTNSSGTPTYANVHNYAHTLRYRAFGAIKGMTYGNGKVLSALYDSRLRMTKWDVQNVLGYEYFYDNSSDPSLWLSDKAHRVVYARNVSSGTGGGGRDASLDRSFDYDHVGRLRYSHSGVEARMHAYNQPNDGGQYGPYAHHYNYDQFGNINDRIGWGGANASYTATYTDNRRNGLSHDLAGNVVHDGGQAFQYDATGQQVYATYNSLTQAYDGDGLRVRKSDGGATTYYLRSTVLGRQVAAEINSSGGWQKGFVYLGSQLLALQEGSAAPAVRWTHQDPYVKSQRLTDAGGAVTAGVELDPWGGNTSRSWNQYQQPRVFTTYTRDSNESDEAMMRRYNRWWSRFDQPDPYDGSYRLSDPQSLNRYSYTQNDPVNFTDPSGLDLIAPDIIDEWVDVFAEDDWYTQLVDRSFGDRLGWVVGPIRLIGLPTVGGGEAGGATAGGGSTNFQDKPQLERNLSRDTKNFDIWNECFREAAADQLGIKEVAGLLAATPISKRAVGLPVTKGASEYTNPISLVGHKYFRGANLPFQVLGTNRIFGIAGRAVPFVNLAIAAYDIHQIHSKANDCYNNRVKPMRR